MTHIVDEDGYLSRIIINKVDLDHLLRPAGPANPDRLDMAMMRSAPDRRGEGQHPGQARPRDARSLVRLRPLSPQAPGIDSKDPKLEDLGMSSPLTTT